jgi:hypothetical protein
VFTKFTALPYALFLFLRGARRQAVLAVSGAVVMAMIWSPLLINQFGVLAEFYTRFLRNKGLYGFTQKGADITAFEALLKSLEAMLVSMPFEIGSVAALAVAMVVAYFARRRIPLLVILVVVASFLCLAAMLRQPVPRYFLPMTPLLALGLVWLMLELRQPARFHPLAAVGLKLVPLAALAFVLVINLQSAKAWVERLALNQRQMVAYEEDISQRGECYLMRPRDQLTGLYFGTGWARSDLIRNVLNAEYGDFITYGHYGRRELFDFSGVLTAEEIRLKQKALGKRLCGIFNDPWTIKLDEGFYEVLERKGGLTAVRVRDPIVP